MLRRRALELGATTYLSKSADLQHVADFLCSVGTFGGHAARLPGGAGTVRDAPGTHDEIDCVDVRTAEGRCVQLTRRQSQVLEQRVQESGIAVLFKPATGPALLGALAALSRP